MDIFFTCWMAGIMDICGGVKGRARTAGVAMTVTPRGIG
jgi:hypothetical protein